jgi:DNA-directed RNA polymerase sigma subunit (sigma70/sigma32)
VAWCAVLPLRDDLAAAAVADNDPGAQLLTLRFGWQGEAPRTAAEAATQLRIDPRRAAMTTAQAFRRLRAHARTR